MPAFSAPTAEETVKLLVSCIRHSTGGKINWAGVSKDCDITANAASKRYKKVLDSHNVSATGSSSARRDSDSPVPATKEEAKGKGKAAGGAVTAGVSNKKRKIQQVDQELDEEEGEDLNTNPSDGLSDLDDEPTNSDEA